MCELAKESLVPASVTGETAVSNKHKILQPLAAINATAEVSVTGEEGDLSEIPVSYAPVLIALPYSCITRTKDSLLMKPDNLVHFISADCILNTPISRELIDEGILVVQSLKNEKPEIGQVLVFKYGNQLVFNLVVKNTFDERPFLKNVNMALHCLKDSMIAFEVKEARLSDKGNGLDRLSWHYIENAIVATFGGKGYTFTICSNEIRHPRRDELLNIMKEHHDAVCGGHFGVNKVYKNIRENFYWENMKRDIADYIRTCDKCQKNKLDRLKTRQPMRITDTPKEAFDKVQVDIVGPLPVTESGNKYLLTLQDSLTKFSDCIPLSEVTSVSVALALAENFISRFGCPKVIQTDQGSQFMSQMMETFCEIFKIRLMNSTAYHPESLGALERSHHTFIQYLKQYCTNRNWDRWIRFAMFSFNTHVH